MAKQTQPKVEEPAAEAPKSKIKHLGNPGRYSKSQTAVFFLIFGLIGGFLLFKTFAAAPVVGRVEVESFAKPAWGSYPVSEPAASGGKAMLMYGENTISGTITNSLDATSVLVNARTTKCENKGGTVTVFIDGSQVLSTTLISTTYTTFTAPKNIVAGTHNIAVRYTGDYFKKGNCDRNIYVDRVDLLGSETLPAAKPTVTLTANPASVTSGQPSTLSWTSKDAQTCTASGAWSGAKGVTGSESTGNLTASSTYTLTCSGSGGTTVASATVTVNNPVTAGVFQGSYYDNSDFTALKLIRNDPKIDFDWSGGSPDPSIGADTFSVRWVGDFTFENANYTFTATVDDGVRLYIDNTLVMEKWLRQSPTTYSVDRALTAGNHNIKLEYYEEVGGASVKFGWVKAATPTPSPTPPPPPPVSSPTSFMYGIVTGGDVAGGLRLSQSLGTHIARSYDTNYSAAPSSMDSTFLDAAKKGIELVLLIGFDAAPPDGGTAGDMAARFGPGGVFWQAGQPGAGYGQYAMRYIEWGNENSYSYSPKPGLSGGGAYANSAKSAYDRIQAKNSQVKLLLQADDGNSGSSQWVDGMFSAQPNIKNIAGCWVIHPYGPPANAISRINRLVSQTAARGGLSTTPICITEDGFATDNGRCLNDNYGWNKCMTYAEAGSSLRDKVSQLRAQSFGPRLLMYLQYASKDQRATGATTEREHYFGIYQSTEVAKGDFTQASKELASQYKAH